MFPWKFLIVGVLFLLVATGCSSGSGVSDLKSSSPVPPGNSASSSLVSNNAALAAIKNLDNDTLLDICMGFHLIRYGGVDFEQRPIRKASDISPTGMYTYIVDTDKNIEQFYDKTERKYKIPVAYAQDYIDRHFDGYTFEPGKIRNNVYDSKTKALVAAALPSPDTGFPEISKKEAIGPDTIKVSVTYFDRYEDQKSDRVLYTETITLKIVGNDYKFVSSAITKQAQNTSNTSGEPSVSTADVSASTADVMQVKQEILNYVIVQRGQDSVRVGFQNDASDKLRTLRSYGLVSDVENLLWIASRGGDSEGEKKMITELPVIQESCKSNIGKGNIWFDNAVDSKNVWIRLNYKPFIPGQGVNAWGHKDLIVYIDTGDHDNAILGIQDAQDTNVWKIIPLPGYGPWLEKEIDMLLRLTIAM